MCVCVFGRECVLRSENRSERVHVSKMACLQLSGSSPPLLAKDWHTLKHTHTHMHTHMNTRCKFKHFLFAPLLGLFLHQD